MSTVITLKTIAEGLGLEFVYADLNYANWLKEGNYPNFPCLILMPVTISDQRQTSGRLASTLEFEGYFLQAHTEETIQFDHLTKESDTIEPMRLLARKFIHHVDDSDLIDPETTGIGDKVKYTPIYEMLDRHCFGVFAQASFPIVENTTIC